MADNSCDIPQTKSGSQETEEPNTVCVSDTGMEQSVPSDRSSSSALPQERSVHQILDGNAESLVKFEEGIDKNQELGESKNNSVPQERSVLQPVVGNAESMVKFEKGIDQIRELGESKNNCVPEERSVLQPVVGNAESLEKFEKGVDKNQEPGESKNISVSEECSVLHPVVGNAESLEKLEKGIDRNQESGECKSISVPEECSVRQPVVVNAESMVKLDEGINQIQEFGESKNTSVPQKRSVLHPVVRNAGSLAKLDKRIYRNHGDSKNISGSEILKCGLNFDVIDDTAVIETGIGGVHGEGFAGFALYPKKSPWRQMKEQETYEKNVKSWQKVRPGSSVGSRTSRNEKGVTPTRLVENQNVYKKVVYQRKFVVLDEQTKERRTGVHSGSGKFLRSNGNGKALTSTRNVDGQNLCHGNYPKMDMEEGQSCANVEEEENKKTTKVHRVWRKRSKTNSDEKSFAHKVEDQNRFEEKGKGSEMVHYSECSREDSEEKGSAHKVEDQNRSEEKGKGSESVQYSECSREDSDESVRGNMSEGSKMVYTRDEMEALRYVEVEEQRKTWAEIYYLGLTPEIMKEYDSLIPTSSAKHNNVNSVAKRSVIGSSDVKSETEPAQQIAVK